MLAGVGILRSARRRAHIPLVGAAAAPGTATGQHLTRARPSNALEHRSERMHFGAYG